MSRLFRVDPTKARHSAIVARHVDAFLAAGHQIQECPAGQETWKLWAVEQPNGELTFKRAKTLPDLRGRKQARKAAQEAAKAAKQGPCQYGHQLGRYERNGDCIQCAREREQQRRAARKQQQDGFIDLRAFV